TYRDPSTEDRRASGRLVPLSRRFLFMSRFHAPTKPKGITFLIRGEPGTGKTRFALGLTRIARKPVAFIGTDRGAKFYSTDASTKPFVLAEAKTSVAIDAAIGEVSRARRSFGGVINVSATVWWYVRQYMF